MGDPYEEPDYEEEMAREFKKRDAEIAALKAAQDDIHAVGYRDGVLAEREHSLKATADGDAEIARLKAKVVNLRHEIGMLLSDLAAHECALAAVREFFTLVDEELDPICPQCGASAGTHHFLECQLRTSPYTLIGEDCRQNVRHKLAELRGLLLDLTHTYRIDARDAEIARLTRALVAGPASLRAKWGSSSNFSVEVVCDEIERAQAEAMKEKP